MQSPRLREIEVYSGVPIIELAYDEPVLLTREAHEAQLEALREYPAERFAVVISYNNISCSAKHGPAEEAELYEREEYRELHERLLCLLRYHAHSLTALISTMSAHSLLRAGASNFAPDLDSAVRAARRAIDMHTERESVARTEA